MASVKKTTTTGKPGVQWSPIKKALGALSREELLVVVKELYDFSPANRTFLAARFAAPGESGAALEEYRDRVVKAFYTKRGPVSTPKLAEGRKAIREYQKATSDVAGTIDLLITYVEAGTLFTKEFGDMWEAFYSSLESAFHEAEKLLVKANDVELYKPFEPRLDKLAKDAGWMGWGYGDEITYVIDELRAKFAGG